MSTTTKNPPRGFTYVSPTAEELSRRGKSNARMVRCLRCGTRIWGSGMGLGSHRRKCEHEAWLEQSGQRPATPPADTFDARAEVATAMLRGDFAALTTALHAGSEVTDTGCWLWPDINHRGFPNGVRVAGVRRGGLHKQIAMTAGQHHARDEGVVVTRTCGETACVNPEHVQVVGSQYSAAEYASRRGGSDRPVPAGLDNLFSEIASVHLGIGTLNTRMADSLDFHEVAVWQVRAALREAWEAGRTAGRQEGRR